MAAANPPSREIPMPEGTLIDIRQIAALAERAQRSPIVVANDGTRRAWLYSDAKRIYEPIEPPTSLPRMTRKVGDVQSLIDVVLAEGKRLEAEAVATKDGLYMTALFGSQGAHVYLREDQGKESPVVQFERSKSFALRALEGAVTGWQSHENFLLTLANLSPWMEGGKSVLAAFRKVSSDTTQGMVSQPFLDDRGESTDAYRVEVKVRGANVDTKLPAVLSLQLPLTPRPAQFYDVEVWVDIGGAMKDGGGFVPKFRLIAPELKSVLEQAAADEVTLFTANVRPTLPQIVIVNSAS